MSDGTMFAGDHPRSGDFETLKGRMLTPPELPYDVQDKNMGDARFNGEVKGPQGWEASLKPNEPLTRGGGTMAK